MSDVRFYHIERGGVDQVLPALLNKALSQGHKIIVKTASDQQAEQLNTHLWSYDPNSFLPHGSGKDGHAEAQPIWLTAKDENPNGADVLILIGGAQSEAIADFALCCEMLDGNNPNEVSAARGRWKTYKEDGHDVTYWQQGAKGWEKKA